MINHTFENHQSEALGTINQIVINELLSPKIPVFIVLGVSSGNI